MKNVSLAINNGAIGYTPPPAPMQQPSAPFTIAKLYSISFSAQFDEEAEALKFAAELLKRVTGDAE